MCVCVLVLGKYQNAYATSKIIVFLGNKDILAVSDNFKGSFEG